LQGVPHFVYNATGGTHSLDLAAIY